MNHRSFKLTVPALLGLLACSNQESPATKGAGTDADAGTGTGTDAGNHGPYKIARTSCGNIPIQTTDYWDRPAPDACKAAVEANCCTQAEACAADADCKARMECIATGRDPCTPATNAIADAYWGCENALYSECIDLSCVGKEPPAPPTEPQRVRLRMLDSPSQMVPMDARVKVCAAEDLTCATPLSDGTTDADGYIDLEFPPGPGGTTAYYEVTGATTVPTIFFTPRLFSARLPAAITRYRNDSAQLAGLRGLLGAPEDATRGMLVVWIRSCAESPSPGLRFDSSAADGTTIKAYAANEFPSTTATMTDGSVFIASGYLANHPAGRTTITVTDAATGSHYGSVDVVVRGGFFTSATIVPSL